MVQGRNLSNNRSTELDTKREGHTNEVVSLVMYRAETLLRRVNEQNMLKVIRVEELNNMCGVTRKDRMTNEKVNCRMGATKRCMLVCNRRV